MTRIDNSSWLIVTAVGVAAGLAACKSDPRYVDPNAPLEVGVPGSDTNEGMAVIEIPFRLERDDEIEKREARAAELGVEVPYVKLDDVKVSMEWSAENLGDNPAEITILVNGATEFAAFVPANFVIDPDEDEEPPPLMGGIPMILEPGELRTGVFREDQVYEASVDLELMYRAGYNPFAAVLEQNATIPEIIDLNGASVPPEVFASMVRFDITVRTTGHMIFRYAVRVRDERGILHKKLLNPDDPGELTTFDPVEIMPPMMTP
jgi:hypothetical protein